MSALIDSISVQSEPLLTDTGHHSSVAMTTTTMMVEEQATVIKNYDAISSEFVDRVETTDTSKRTLAEEGVEHDNIAMGTVIENKDTCDSMPSTPMNTKSASALHKDGKKEKEREGERDLDSCDGVEGGDTDRTVVTDTNTQELSLPQLPAIRVEGTDKGFKEEAKAAHELQLPKDILYFMRDEQSQTQLKQVHVHV